MAAADTTEAPTTVHVRIRPPNAPRGRQLLPWIGPGILWMISAVGTGSVLFTPRVASQYEYTLLWVLVGVCGLMWVMIREAARYTVVTGMSLLDGFDQLPGPGHWAVWSVFVPQILAAVAGIAGLASIVGSAASVAIGGDHRLWAAGLIAASTILVVTEGYHLIERAARILAGLLVAITVAAAASTAPSIGEVLGGLSPSLPADPDLYVIGPWIGTILAGSMGIVWFSYWTAARGFGGVSPLAEERADEEVEPIDEDELVARLSGWVRAVSWAAAVGVIAGTVVLVAYTVLGAELLAPEGILPEGENVAGDLSRLLADLWGRLGFWLMILAVVVALGGSVLANQDGWGRSFADMTLLVRPGRRTSTPRFDRGQLRAIYVATLTGIAPVVVVLLVSDPVAIMSASGLVAALHTPFIVALILLVNRLHLPAALQPGLMVSGLMVGSAVLYAGVGSLQIVGG